LIVSDNQSGGDCKRLQIIIKYVALKTNKTPHHRMILRLVDVTKVEIAATEKDTAIVVEHLKAAGKWTMDFSKELSKDVAAIKHAMGML
jgi:hypothetical protein